MSPSGYWTILVVGLGATFVSLGLYLLIFRRWPIIIGEPVSDTSIARTANSVVKRHKENAAQVALARAEELESKGDAAGAEAWRRVHTMVEGMLAAKSDR